MTLRDLNIGEEAVITRVTGAGPLRLRLLDMGIIPKTRIMVRKTAPLGDPIQICVRGYELTIRKDDAAMIEVEKVGEQSDICPCGKSEQR